MHGGTSKLHLSIDKTRLIRYHYKKTFLSQLLLILFPILFSLIVPKKIYTMLSKLIVHNWLEFFPHLNAFLYLLHHSLSSFRSHDELIPCQDLFNPVFTCFPRRRRRRSYVCTQTNVAAGRHFDIFMRRRRKKPPTQSKGARLHIWCMFSFSRIDLYL